MSNTTDPSISINPTQVSYLSDSSQDTVSDYKTPRPSEGFFANFECPTCMDYFIPPVVHCPNEHYFCLNCIERQAFTSMGYKCPLCRTVIDVAQRSRRMEEQLEQLFVPCCWKERGCKKIVEIARRSLHQNCCKYSENVTGCFYKDSKFYSYCGWTGTPIELADHLIQTHNQKKYDIDDSISFLWDIPNINNDSIRPRIIDLAYPGKGTARSLFFLEFFYNAEAKCLLFLVRTADSDVKLDYSICLNDKKNDRIYALYFRKTIDFKGVQLKDYPNCDVSNIVYVPYRYMEDIKVDKDGQDFFSFAIKFTIEE